MLEVVMVVKRLVASVVVVVSAVVNVGIMAIYVGRGDGGEDVGSRSSGCGECV